MDETNFTCPRIRWCICDPLRWNSCGTHDLGRDLPHFSRRTADAGFFTCPRRGSDTFSCSIRVGALVIDSVGGARSLPLAQEGALNVVLVNAGWCGSRSWSPLYTTSVLAMVDDWQLCKESACC